jgi:signal transduction histidine kinase
MKINCDGEWVRFRILPVWSANEHSRQIGRLVLLDEWASELESSRHLLAVTSHELRAPLTSIIGNIELLVRELLGPISIDQRESLNSIARHGMRMRDIINDVMTLSSIENGSIWVEPEPISINGIIQEILPSFEQQHGAQSIKLIISISDDLPPVAGGLYAIRTIFSKLLDNAYRYTLPNGQIMIRGKRVGRQVRIDIEDTGIGISDSARPHIFVELAHDYDNPLISPNRYSHGIGMSLVIVKKLVDLHGGNIWFKSAVGQGSSFSFTLPLSEAV